MVTIGDAKAKLEADGLHVSCTGAQSLWIAATLRDMGEGIKLSNDACSLLWNSGEWVAVFPAEGLRTYEVPGTLSELVSIIVAVYAQYRRTGGPFNVACKLVLEGAGHFLAGHSPAHT